MPDTYTLLFEADSTQALKNAVPSLSELGPGRQGRFEIRGFGLGPLADIAGAELIWKNQMAAAGLIVTDVHGEGWDLAVVEWVTEGQQQAVAGQVQAAVGVVVLLIILAVIGALLALNWLISNIKGLVKDVAQAALDLAPLLLGGAALFLLLSNRKAVAT